MRARRALRVAMVAACPFPLRRGTPVRIFRIAEALALRGHDVHVVTYHLGDAVSSVPFQIHRIPDMRGYRKLSAGPTYRKLFLLDPLLRRTLRTLLSRQRFDLLHAHHYEGLLVARSLPRRSRPPLIYDAHTLLGSELPYYSLGLSRRVKRALGAFMDRKLPGQAAHVIGVTESLRNRLVEIGAVPADRISVIGSGVEVDLFDVPAAPRPTRETVVFAGNLAAYQGIEFLLHAFQQVSHRRRNVQLRIITESDFRPYEAVAYRLGIREHIELLNIAFEDLPSYLRAADVAVNPRVDCEGIPQKLMNYMAAGCPIVSFAGSAVHIRHGLTGWTVPDADVAALADGILRLLEDPGLAKRLGTAAREQIVQEYSWERVAEKIEAVYGRILSSGSPAVRVAAGVAIAGAQGSALPSRLDTVPIAGSVATEATFAALPRQSRSSTPAPSGSDTRPPAPLAAPPSPGPHVQLPGMIHRPPSPPLLGDEPVRVLFLYDHLGYPNGVVHGLTRYCINVLPRLDSGAVELTACFLRGLHPAAEVLQRGGVSPIFLARAKWDPRALTDVVRLIRRDRIEIVHAVGQKGILVGCAAARLTECGTIIHLRDVYPLARPVRTLMRLAARGVDVALGVSEAACRHAVDEYGVERSRAELLYNGIDLDAFAPPEPAKVAAWRRGLGIPGSSRAIGVIGRLSAVKGHAGLIRQMSRIRASIPAAVLVVVGDGPLRRQLEALADELNVADAVRFVGQQDDVRTVLGALDVVAIPSEHEGLCNVALEALAVGRPVVAFDVGGLPEALNRGANGVLVPAHDAAGFADALMRVLEDPVLPGQLVRGARRHLDGFTLSRHVERQREIYLRLAHTVRARRSRSRLEPAA